MIDIVKETTGAEICDKDLSWFSHNVRKDIKG